MKLAHVSELKQELEADWIALNQGLQQAVAAAGAADRELLRWIAACDRAALWRRNGARSMAEWLSAVHQISNWKARRMIEASYALEALPRIAAALASGALSLDKTVELVRFATTDTEEKLLEWARRVTVARIRERAEQENKRPVEEAAQVQQERYVSWWWSFPDSNLLGFEGVLPADEGARFIAAIDRLANDLPRPPLDEGSEHDPWLSADEASIDQRRADALVLLAMEAAGERKSRDRTELVLEASLEALRDDHSNCTYGGGLLHPETARRLACDACVELVLTGTDGAPVGIGRASQITPRWLRRAVLRRDAHTCTFPGCEMRRFLTPHHIWHWIRGGPTELDNLITVCSFHHKLVHELGWSVILENGSAVWFRPGGRRYAPGPAPPEEAPKPRAQPLRLAEAAGYSRIFDLVPVLGATSKENPRANKDLSLVRGPRL